MMLLPQAVEAVERLDLADQILLRSILSGAVYKKETVHKKRKGEQYSSLLASGFVIEVDEPSGVVLSPDLLKVRKKLCTYLTRRNENEACIDENGRSYEIPKGAQFVGLVSIGGYSLSLEFPDDEITALLDLHGVNRCREWAL